MSEAIIRHAREEDLRTLRMIWTLAFDDESRLVDVFHEHFFTPENCLVAELHGKVCAGAYMIRGIRLLDGKGAEKPAAYFYALATHPNYRGQDLGTMVTRSCLELARERGEVLCLFPEDEDLRRWYAHMNGLRDLGGRNVIYTNPRLCALPPKFRICEISPADYVAKRELMLAQRVHAALPESYFNFQASLFALAGAGALVEFEIDGVKGLACVQQFLGSLDVKELLYEGHPKTAAAVLMKHFEADGSVLYMPADEEQDEVTVMADGAFKEMCGLWWGPMLD